MSLAAIALGSNLGDREVTMRHAIVALRQLGEVRAVSAFYETDPVGYTDQPQFLNAAVLLETAIEPLPLLDALLVIEREAGRDRATGPPKGPRTLDLDLLLYGDAVISSPHLTVPHPEMHLRRFVLEPLAEIAPAMLHPVCNANIGAILKELGQQRSR